MGRITPSAVWECPVTIGERGRMGLPALLREKLGLHAGERLLVRPEADSSIRLISYRSIANAKRGLFAELSPGRSLVDELIAERRSESAKAG